LLSFEVEDQKNEWIAALEENKDKDVGLTETGAIGKKKTEYCHEI